MVVIFNSNFTYIHKSEEDPSINDYNEASKACIHPSIYSLHIISIVSTGILFLRLWFSPVLNVLVV